VSYCFFTGDAFVNRFARILGVLLAVVIVTLAVPAMAQDGGSSAAPAAGGFGITFSPSIGVGLTVIGAAYGIGKLASAAFESMARQPEVAGQINTAMIIAGALIEGATLFALVIFFLGLTK
jgi:F-type H+-transporting ATPase subunit c